MRSTCRSRVQSRLTCDVGVFSGSADASLASSALGGDVARDVFVARQPIFDTHKRVYAYELLFRGGLENFCPVGDPNRAAAEVLQATWLTFGLSALVGERKAFTNFTRDLLIGGYGETLPAQSTVIELFETIDGDPDVVEACHRLKKQGYTLALDDFVYRPALDPLIPLADVVKINFRATNPGEQADHVRRLSSDEPRLLAEMVETAEEYEQVCALGFHFFQGYFFCEPQVMTGRKLSGSQVTHLKLLQSVTRPALVIDEMEAILKADVSATHRLMTYLGSAAFGFRAEIRSIRHALVLMGKQQIRRWVSLVALGEMNRNKPSELLMQAAVRGKFCECLSEAAGMANREAELFLVGSLSLVDAMLDQPMAKVLDELPLADDVRLALQGDARPLRPVLDFVEGYERGDWTACTAIGHDLGIPESTVLDQYREAVSWATNALT